MKNLLFLILFFPSIIFAKGFTDKLNFIEFTVKSEKISVNKDQAKVTIDIFGGENSISIKRNGVFDTPITSENNIKLDALKESVLVTPDIDKFSFDLILKENPNTTKFDFIIDGDDDYDFFFQPPLTQEEIDRGDIRPDDVVGSYAIYHKNKKWNKYTTGKAFHIYRPKVVDFNGNWIWGDLIYTKGILRVIVDKDFLDNAVYPVLIDPTFGNTSKGASSSAPIINFFWGTKATAPGDGTITGISVWGGDNAGPNNFKGVLCLYSALTIVANGVGNAAAFPLSPPPVSATESVMAGNPTITNGTNYLLGSVYDGTVNFVYFDTGGGTNESYTDSSNSYSTPTDPTDGTGGTSKVSIFATYTASGGGGRTRRTITVE